MGIEGQFRGLTAPIRSEPAFVKEGRGNSYFYDIRRFAMLEKNHEYELAKRWRDAGDRDAANALVNSHLRLAAKPWATAATVFRSPKSSPKAMSA